MSEWKRQVAAAKARRARLNRGKVKKFEPIRHETTMEPAVWPVDRDQPIGPGKKIAMKTAEKHGFDWSAFTSSGRAQTLCHARQEAMYLMRVGTALSYPQIAAILGLKDHTTVMYGIKAHKKRVGIL